MKNHPDVIARICHEVNRAYCASIGDNSQPSWDEAPDWQKESAIKGVMFHMENPDATPEDSHQSWYDQKWEQGWVYGPTKDEAKKEHPCMVKYHHLPPEQRSKDYLFRGVVHAMLAEPKPIGPAAEIQPIEEEVAQKLQAQQQQAAAQGEIQSLAGFAPQDGAEQDADAQDPDAEDGQTKPAEETAPEDLDPEEVAEAAERQEQSGHNA